MTGRRIKQANRCSEKECNRPIRHWNKSGLCHNHYHAFQRKNYKQTLKEQHKCFNCWGKVEPIIKYPAGDTIPPIKKYPIRCYKCLQKITLVLKKKKKLINSSYSSSNISKNKKRYENKKKANKICVSCSTPLEPIITYPAGDTIPPITKYLIRCYNCRQKRNLNQKEYRKLKKKDNVTIIK